MSAAQLYAKHLDLFQDMKRKEVALKACKLWDIELPADQFRVDFDFQNSVAILQNKTSGQTIIIHGGSQDEQSISFGKQLIDTFKPKSVLVDDGPLQAEKVARAISDEGFVTPAEYDLTVEINGTDA